MCSPSTASGPDHAPGGEEEDTDGGFAHGGWSHPFFDDTVGGWVDAAMDGVTALLYGRRTWQVMAGAWPERAGDEFADRMNALPKHVASRTLSHDEVAARWAGSQLLDPDDAVAAVGRLRRDGGDGGLLVFGSPGFASQLLSAGEVDELRRIVMPLLLGGGKRLFPDDGGKRDLELVETATAATGAVLEVHRPRHGAPMP